MIFTGFYGRYHKFKYIYIHEKINVRKFSIELNTRTRFDYGSEQANNVQTLNWRHNRYPSLYLLVTIVNLSSLYHPCDR